MLLLLLVALCPALPAGAESGVDVRVAMVLAVLEARCGFGFGDQDVYLNVAGGLRINEPAADLAAAAVHLHDARAAHALRQVLVRSPDQHPLHARVLRGNAERFYKLGAASN